MIYSNLNHAVGSMSRFKSRSRSLVGSMPKSQFLELLYNSFDIIGTT